jgi:hypothetical protein
MAGAFRRRRWPRFQAAEFCPGIPITFVQFVSLGHHPHSVSDNGTIGIYPAGSLQSLFGSLLDFFERFRDARGFSTEKASRPWGSTNPMRGNGR